LISSLKLWSRIVFKTSNISIKQFHLILNNFKMKFNIFRLPQRFVEGILHEIGGQNLCLLIQLVWDLDKYTISYANNALLLVSKCTISYGNNTLLLVDSGVIYIMWWLENWRIYNDMGTRLHQLSKNKRRFSI